MRARHPDRATINNTAAFMVPLYQLTSWLLDLFHQQNVNVMWHQFLWIVKIKKFQMGVLLWCMHNVQCAYCEDSLKSQKRKENIWWTFGRKLLVYWNELLQKFSLLFTIVRSFHTDGYSNQRTLIKKITFQGKLYFLPIFTCENILVRRFLSVQKKYNNWNPI